jgi:hypothetical protein
LNAKASQLRRQTSKLQLEISKAWTISYHNELECIMEVALQAYGWLNKSRGRGSAPAEI